MKSLDFSVTTAVVAVYIIFVRKEDGLILIMHRRLPGSKDGLYDVPGGIVEAGELPTETAVKAARKDVGVIVERYDLSLIHVSSRPRYGEADNRMTLFYTCQKWGKKIVNAEPGKCDDLQWVSWIALPENISPLVKVGILYGFRKIFSSEFTIEQMKVRPILQI